MNAMAFDVPSVEELMRNLQAKFIISSANYFGYSGSTDYLIVNWVHPLFPKTKAAASKEDYPNWWEAMHSFFAYEY